MTTATQTTTKVDTSLMTILLVAALGASMLLFSGFAQSAVLHDAAHDVRHAAGFPCH